MKVTRSLVIAAMFAALAAPVFSQGEQPPGRGFFLESIAPESHDGIPTTLMPDPNQYQIDLRLSGLGVRRSFQRTEVELRDAAFGTGIQEATTTGATLNLGVRTALSFSRDERQIADVFSQMREQHAVTSMQLTQQFGSGDSSGALTLYRALQTDRTPAQGELQTEIRRLGLTTGLGPGASFQAGWETQESAEPGRLSQSGYQGDLRMNLSGGEALAHYDYLQRLVEGRQSARRQLDLVAPFAVPGGAFRAEHHLIEELADNYDKTTRRTALTLPLGFISSGALASYVVDEVILNDARNCKSVLSFAVPLTLFGTPTRLEHVATETIVGTAVTDEAVMRLAAQFGASQALVERWQSAVTSGDTVTRQRRLRIESPLIPISRYASLAAGQTRTEVVGVSESRTSHIDLAARPLTPLEISARYLLYDHPDGRSTADRSVQTVLALSDTSTLRGSFTQAERLDNAPAITRHLEVQRNPHGDGDLTVRVGYTDYGVQCPDDRPAVLAQVSVGSANRLGVSATYAEYDQANLTPLPEPATAVELRVGQPERLALRAAFTEQPSRVQPERTVGIATSLLGGSLHLSYVDNPLDPTGRSVMVSDLYELGFRRTVFGSVGLDLGYRYWLPEDGEGPESYYKLQLDGGSEDGGGKIALSFRSGHFVPYPTTGAPPASLLDLSYTKRWDDRGRLVITVSRQEPPVASVGLDDNLEAQLKYQMRF